MEAEPVRSAYLLLYDGSDPVCALNASGSVTAVNTFGANGLLSRDNLVTQATTYYTFDEHGNVAQRTSSTGAVLSSDLYDAFGARTSTATLLDPWGFGAQWGYYTDIETGLVLCTHRFYDPAQGRFVTRDPAGYGGGVNLYSYTQNNPINRSDPSGLALVLALAGGGTLTTADAVAAVSLWPLAGVAAAGAAGYGMGTLATLAGTWIADRIHGQDGLPAAPYYASGDKSKGEYEQHQRDLAGLLEQERQLEDELAKAKGPKTRDPIKDALDQVRNGKNGIRGHQKEIGQKWPNGCPNK